jgi:MFS family permease
VSTATTAETNTGVGRTWQALQNRNYRLYWFGQVVSVTGTWMQNTGMAWLVLEKSDSALALGSVSTVQFTPFLIFALFGGVLADRLPKRRLLIGTQSVLLVQAAILATLVALGNVALWQIYVLAGVQGMANALDNPTRQAFIVEMVGPEDLPNAIALNSGQQQVGRLCGPALGGVTIALLGVSGCFFLNACSFLAVLAALIFMDTKRLFVPPPLKRGGKVLGQVAEGLKYALKTPNIAFELIMMVMLGTFGFNMTVLLPLIARYVLHSGSSGFGLVTSALALGSLIAALSVAYVSKATLKMLLFGATSFSCMLLVVAVSHWWLLTLPMMVGLGYSSTFYRATNNSRLQLEAPPQLRGRIMSLNSLLFQGTTPVGALVIGVLADVNGVQAATAELGIACLLGVIAAVIYYRAHHNEMITDDELNDRNRRIEDFHTDGAAAEDAPRRVAEPAPAGGS